MGEGSNNYRYFGSAVIESTISKISLSRCSFTAIQQHSVVVFLRCVFASDFKYVFIILPIIDANGLQDYISIGQQVPLSSIVIRSQAELNRIPSDAEDLWIANFVIGKQKSLILNQQQSMKNLTIGINALNGLSVLELSGLGTLERVVIMRGGLYGGSGRMLVTNCSKLRSIDIGEYAFMKYKYLEWMALPLLQTIKLDNSAFQKVYSIMMESKYRTGVMNKICMHLILFNWAITHFREREEKDG